MEITEKQYLEAISIINQYTEQVKKKTEKTLKSTGITKTPKAISTTAECASINAKV